LMDQRPNEALLRAALKPQAHITVAELKDHLRKKLPEVLPGTTYSFEAEDIVSQVLSMGSPTPIEIAVTSPKMDANIAMAKNLMAKLQEQSTWRDLQFGQPPRISDDSCQSGPSPCRTTGSHGL